MSTIIGTTLNADTIRKTGGSLGTDIRIKNTSVYESDGGTSVTQNLVQGLAKCWIDYTSASSYTTNDSFNVSSLTDGGTGLGQTNISNDMANINYSLTQGCRGGAANGTKIFQNGNKAVGSFQLYTVDRDGGAFDIANTMATVHGDLA